MVRWITFFLGLAFLVGCGPKIEMRSDPIPISGKVTAGGKPVGKIVLSFYPMEGQHPVGFKVGEDGSYSGTAIPGKYAYFVPVEGSDPVAIGKVGPKFREADLSRSITVSLEKSTVDIALD